MSDTETWSSIGASGNEQVTLVAAGDGSLLVHGREFSQDGADYTALAETMDYDFKDPALVKHIEGVQVSLDLRETDTQDRLLYVQVGTRMNKDGTIRWSSAKSIKIQGNGQNPTRVPFSQTGRFCRLRFYSNDADVRWRVSGFEIYARSSGTY